MIAVMRSSWESVTLTLCPEDALERKDILIFLFIFNQSINQIFIQHRTDVGGADKKPIKGLTKGLRPLQKLGIATGARHNKNT